MEAGRGMRGSLAASFMGGAGATAGAGPQQELLVAARAWSVSVQSGNGLCVSPSEPARASGLDGAEDTGVMERASADADRSIPPNRRQLPDHRLAPHRVNGENALALPAARSRPTSPRHPQRPRGDARSRPVELPGLVSCPLHTCASLCLRDRSGARAIGCPVTTKPLKEDTEPRCLTHLNLNSGKQVVQKSWNAMPFSRAVLMGRAGKVKLGGGLSGA